MSHAIEKVDGSKLDSDRRVFEGLPVRRPHFDRGLSIARPLDLCTPVCDEVTVGGPNWTFKIQARLRRNQLPRRLPFTPETQISLGWCRESTGYRSLQLRIFRFRLLQNGDVGIGVFPEREEIAVGGTGFGAGCVG